MKIPYKYFKVAIEEKPSINSLSNKFFQLGHEHQIVNNIFDFEITPNRGDCLSLDGLLRDLKVFFNIQNHNEVYTNKIDNLRIEFKNNSKSFCPKISFAKIKIKNSVNDYKGELKNYFDDLNIPTNNFFTDISNYLMFETGQPTHCYDFDKLTGKIILEEIDYDASFDSVVGKKINLSGNNHVFKMNNEIINLAGVMGGLSTSCSESTSAILLECAYFQPDSIMGKAVKYDINSEAAHKFERGVDFLSHDRVIRRFIQIVKNHTEIEEVQIISENYKEFKSIAIPLEHEKINDILGSKISEDEYLCRLNALGFVIDNDKILVPSYRNDISSQNDLAEEIARSIGYDNIPLKKIEIQSVKNDKNLFEDKIRSFLITHGFFEVINNPFTSAMEENSMIVDNPLDSNKKYLRKVMINSLIDNLTYNERRQKDSVKLFEISDVYYFEKDELKTKKYLSIIASGRVGKNYQDFSKKINAKYMKGIFKSLFPELNADFKILPRKNLDSKSQSEIIYLEIDIEVLKKTRIEFNKKIDISTEFTQYQGISDFPSSYRDLSFLIKDPSEIEALEKLIFKFHNQILKEVFIFDYFFNKEKNFIKLGFRFVFQSKEKTLTIEEIDNIMNSIIKTTSQLNSVEIPGI